VNISDIALEGAALYTRSCDGIRWITAGVITFYKQRNSVFVSTRHSVDDGKTCSKFHSLLKGVNNFVPVIYIFLDRFRQYSVLEIW